MNKKKKYNYFGSSSDRKKKLNFKSMALPQVILESNSVNKLISLEKIKELFLFFFTLFSYIISICKFTTYLFRGTLIELIYRFSKISLSFWLIICLKVFKVFFLIIKYFLYKKKIIFLFIIYIFFLIPMFYKNSYNFLLVNDFFKNFCQLEQTFSFSSTSPFTTFFNDYPLSRDYFFQQKEGAKSLIPEVPVNTTDTIFMKHWTLLRHYGFWFVNMNRLDYISLKDIYQKGVFPYEIVTSIFSYYDLKFLNFLFNNLIFIFNWFLVSLPITNADNWFFFFKILNLICQTNLDENFFYILNVHIFNFILLVLHEIIFVTHCLISLIYSSINFCLNLVIGCITYIFGFLHDSSHFITTLNVNLPFASNNKRKRKLYKGFRKLITQRNRHFFLTETNNYEDMFNFFENIFLVRTFRKFRRRKHLMAILYRKNFFFFTTKPLFGQTTNFFFINSGFFTNDFAGSSAFKKRSVFFKNSFFSTRARRLTNDNVALKGSKRFTGAVLNYNLSLRDSNFVPFMRTKFFISKFFNKKFHIFNKFSKAYLFRDNFDLFLEKFGGKRGYSRNKRFLFFRRLYDNMLLSNTSDIFDSFNDLFRKRRKHRRRLFRGVFFNSQDRRRKIHFPFDKSIKQNKILGLYFHYKFRFKDGETKVHRQRKRFRFTETIGIFFINILLMIYSFINFSKTSISFVKTFSIASLSFSFFVFLCLIIFFEMKIFLVFLYIKLNKFFLNSKNMMFFFKTKNWYDVCFILVHFLLSYIIFWVFRVLFRSSKIFVNYLFVKEKKFSILTNFYKLNFIAGIKFITNLIKISFQKNFLTRNFYLSNFSFSSLTFRMFVESLFFSIKFFLFKLMSYLFVMLKIFLIYVQFVIIFISIKYLIFFSYDFRKKYTMNQFLVAKHPFIFYELSIYESSLFISLIIFISIFILFLISFNKNFRKNLFNSNLYFSENTGFFDKFIWDDSNNPLRSESYFNFLDLEISFPGTTKRDYLLYNVMERFDLFQESVLEDSFYSKKIAKNLNFFQSFFWYDGLNETDYLSSNNKNYLDLEEFFVMFSRHSKLNHQLISILTLKLIPHLYVICGIFQYLQFKHSLNKSKFSMNVKNLLQILPIFYYKKILSFILSPKINFFTLNLIALQKKNFINFFALVQYFHFLVVNSIRERIIDPIYRKNFFLEPLSFQVNYNLEDIPYHVLEKANFGKRIYFFVSLLHKRLYKNFISNDIFDPEKSFIHNKFYFFFPKIFVYIFAHSALRFRKLNLSSKQNYNYFFHENIYSDTFLLKKIINFDLKNLLIRKPQDTYSFNAENPDFTAPLFDFLRFYNFSSQNEFIFQYDSSIDDIYKIFSSNRSKLFLYNRRKRGKKVVFEDYFSVMEKFSQMYGNNDISRKNQGILRSDYFFNFYKSTKNWSLLINKSMSFISLNSLTIKMKLPFYNSNLVMYLIGRILIHKTKDFEYNFFLKNFLTNNKLRKKNSVKFRKLDGFQEKSFGRKKIFLNNINFLFLHIFDFKYLNLNYYFKFLNLNIKSQNSFHNKFFEIMNFDTRRFFCGRFIMKNLSRGRLYQMDDLFPFFDHSVLVDSLDQIDLTGLERFGDYFQLPHLFSIKSDFLSISSLDNVSEYLDEFDVDEILYNPYLDEHPFSFELISFYGFFEGETSYLFAKNLGSSPNRSFPFELFEFQNSFSYSNDFFFNYNGWISESIIDRFLFVNNGYSANDDIIVPFDISQITNLLPYINREEYIRIYELNPFLKSFFEMENFFLLTIFFKLPFFCIRRIQNFFLLKSLFPFLNYSQNQNPSINGSNIIFGINNHYITSLVDNENYRGHTLLFKNSLSTPLSFFTIFFNPYNKFFIKFLFKFLDIKILSLTPTDAFRNKYTLLFFKNIELYKSFLNLNNFPNLSEDEAERLWALLGCDKKSWFAVEKNYSYVNKSYNNWEFPLFFYLILILITVLLKKQKISLSYNKNRKELYIFFERKITTSYIYTPKKMKKFFSVARVRHSLFNDSIESAFCFRGYFHLFDPFFFYYQVLPFTRNIFINYKFFEYMFIITYEYPFHIIKDSLLFFPGLSIFSSFISFLFYEVFMHGFWASFNIVATHHIISFYYFIFVQLIKIFSVELMFFHISKIIAFILTKLSYIFF